LPFQRFCVCGVSIGVRSGPPIGIQSGPPRPTFRAISACPVGAGRGCGDGASADWHGRSIRMEPSCFLAALTISRSSSSVRAPPESAPPRGLQRRRSPSPSLKLEAGSAAGPIRLLMHRFRSISGAAGCIRPIAIPGPGLRPRPGSQSTGLVPPGALRASTSGSAPRIRTHLLWPPGASTTRDRPQRC
jgi:hypothetical protein